MALDAMAKGLSSARDAARRDILRRGVRPMAGHWETTVNAYVTMLGVKS